MTFETKEERKQRNIEKWLAASPEEREVIRKKISNRERKRRENLTPEEKIKEIAYSNVKGKENFYALSVSERAEVMAKAGVGKRWELLSPDAKEWAIKRFIPFCEMEEARK